jgi:hypothetical protein
MTYVIDTSLDAFVSRLLPGDVLAYDTMTPQGGLIQFADRRNVSHVSMYVGEHMIVDASSRKPEPGEVQKPIRHLRIETQFPLTRDRDRQGNVAPDTVTANRSLIALRHSRFIASPELGRLAAEIAKRIHGLQRVDPNDTPWSFSPNDLLVLTLPVLTRSFETAYQYAPFVGSAKDLIRWMLRILRKILNPADQDYRQGVTCSELVHRILTHKDLQLPLSPGTDGRGAVTEYLGTTRALLEEIAAEGDPDAALLLGELDWRTSPERRVQQLGEIGGLDLQSGGFDASDMVTPGDIWGFPELLPIGGYELPIRSVGPV